MSRTIIKLLSPIIRLYRNIQFKLLYHKFREYTMVPRKVFEANLELMLQFKSIKGDVIECGTWKGGMIGASAQLLGNNKSYYLIDSFEGLPEAKEIDGATAKLWQENKKGKDYHNNCTASPNDAENAMKKSGAINYFIKKGWFEDVLPSLKPENGYSIIRLDGDWYESTMHSIEILFPYLNEGGIVIIDDYKAWDGCARAIHDYLSKNNIPVRIREFHDQVTYIIKP